MHPSKYLIQFLFVTGQSVIEILKEDFKINVTQTEVDKICRGLRNFNQDSPPRIVKSYLERNNLSLKLNKLKRMSLNKRLFYFINTALYRKYPFDTISGLLNTSFSEMETEVLFTAEHISDYANLVMNFSPLNDEDVLSFWKSNKISFDYKNEKKIEQVAFDCGLMPTIDPMTIIKVTSSKLYSKFLQKIDSPNRNDEKDALLFSRQAASIAKNAIELKVAEKGSDAFQRLLMHFSEGDHGIIEIEDTK